MEHNDIVSSLKIIRPTSIYHLKDDELTWLDEVQTKPTAAEIEIGLIAHKAAAATAAATAANEKVASTTNRASGITKALALGWTQAEAELMFKK